MEMACGKLELHLSGTRKVFGSTRRLACPHRHAQLVSHRIPAACSCRQRRDTHCERLTAALRLPVTGSARCCKHAWGRDKSGGGDEHRSFPWEAPSREPQYNRAPDPRQIPSPPRSRLRQDFGSLFLWLQLPVHLY